MGVAARRAGEGRVERDAEVQHAVTDAARGRVDAGAGARGVDALVLALLVVPHRQVERGAGEGVLEGGVPAARGDPAGDPGAAAGGGAGAVGAGAGGEGGRAPRVLGAGVHGLPATPAQPLERHRAARVGRDEGRDERAPVGRGSGGGAGLDDRGEGGQGAAHCLGALRLGAVLAPVLAPVLARLLRGGGALGVGPDLLQREQQEDDHEPEHAQARRPEGDGPGDGAGEAHGRRFRSKSRGGADLVAKPDRLLPNCV